MPRSFSPMRIRLVPVFFMLFLIALFAGSLWRYRAGALIARVLDYGRCDAPRHPLAPLPDSASSSASEIPVRVFASHPLGNRNTLSVARGASARVRRTMPVFDRSGVLVGRVSEVFKEHSAVQLVGSPDWDIPVRIGAGKVSGLLVGGPTIQATMIAGNVVVSAGDTVFAATPDLPYGAPIGVIESVRADRDSGVFQDAVVRLPYSASELTDLTISIWTPDF